MEADSTFPKAFASVHTSILLIGWFSCCLLFLLLSIISVLFLLPAALLILFGGLQLHIRLNWFTRFCLLFLLLGMLHLLPCFQHWSDMPASGPWLYILTATFSSSLLVTVFPVFFKKAGQPFDQFGFPVLFTGLELLVRALFPENASAFSHGLLKMAELMPLTAVIGSGGLTFLLCWLAGAWYFEGYRVQYMRRWIAITIIIAGIGWTLGRFDTLARRDFPGKSTVMLTGFEVRSDSILQDYTSRFFTASRRGAMLVTSQSVLNIKREEEQRLWNRLSRISMHDATAQIMAYQLDSRKHPSVVYVDSSGHIQLLFEGVYRLHPGPNGLSAPMPLEYDPLRDDTEQAGPHQNQPGSPPDIIPVKIDQKEGEPGTPALLFELGRSSKLKGCCREPRRFSMISLLWDEKDPLHLQLSAVDANGVQIKDTSGKTYNGFTSVTIPLEWDRWPVLRQKLGLICLLLAAVVLVWGSLNLWRSTPVPVLSESDKNEA